MLKMSQIGKILSSMLVSTAAMAFAAETHYSVLDSKGKVIKSEADMPNGKTYFCGGIDITDPMKPSIDTGKMCELDEGDYILQARTTADGEENVQKFEFSVATTKYFYSLVDSKGKTIMGEDKMVPGKKYYCGIDLTDALKPTVTQGGMCDLDEGEYTLKLRTQHGKESKTQEMKFSVTSTKSYFSLVDSKGKTLMGEDKMLVGKTYYCGIDLTDAKNPTVNQNKLCDLDEGEYTLKLRTQTGTESKTQEMKFSVTSTKYYFSLVDSKGKTIMGEDKMVPGKKYYCGIDLTNAAKPVVNMGAMCDLAEGDYVLQERVQNGDKEQKQKMEFSVTAEKYYFSLLDSKGKTVLGEDKMLAGKKYYCDGIDLTDPLNVKVNPNIMCDLAEGDYVIQLRVQNGSESQTQKFNFTYSTIKVYYSILDSKGKVVLGEDKMLPGAKYFCAIDLTAIPNINIGADFCNIEKGKYVFQRREVNGEKEKVEKHDFEVVVTSLPGFGLRTAVAQLSISGRIMDMYLENARADYSVMDLQGRVIAKGVLQSHATVVAPMAGTYLVKIGSEVRKVNVR